MAGKGGGAWKVAYADFVTAMMAFFLVMWIVSQDQSTREAVAHYFNDPFGLEMEGTSRSPAEMGAMMDTIAAGSVPDSKAIDAGGGKRSFSDEQVAGHVTRLVGEWLRTDAQALQKWHVEAQEIYDTVAQSASPHASPESIDGAAAQKLARKLRAHLEREIPSGSGGVYEDLMLDSIGRVKWDDLAEELLASVRNRRKGNAKKETG